MFRRLLSAVAVAVALLTPAGAFAQGFMLPDGSAVQGHVRASGAVGAAPPTAVGCTINAAATDVAGLCTTTATSGSITFQRTWGAAPFCLIADADAVSATSMPVYTVSATAITLTTVISAHKLFYFCIGGAPST
jgi:hypothetical protein